MILVAGASGLVGRALVEVLSSGRRPWIELSRRPRAIVDDGSGTAAAACDVTDPSALLRAIPEARSIVHVAGVAPGAKPERGDHELAAMRALLELARARKPERFIFLSATGADPGASDRWLRAKGEAERLLRASGLPFVVLRASLVVGADSPALGALMQVVRAGVKLKLPLLRGGSLRPIAEGDVAIALASALDHHRMVGETVELGAEPAVTLDELLTRVAQRLRQQLSLSRVPFVGHPLARLLERVPSRPLTDGAGFVRLFALLEPPTLALYDRLIPMRRTLLIDALRSMPWGEPPPRPGDPLPTIREPEESGIPRIIPVESLRSTGGPPALPPSFYGRTDAFGRPVGDERSSHASDSSDDPA